MASFGDAMGVTPDCLDVVVNDAVNQTYAKLVLSDDARTLLGGILVGDDFVGDGHGRGLIHFTFERGFFGRRFHRLALDGFSFEHLAENSTDCASVVDELPPR